MTLTTLFNFMVANKDFRVNKSTRKNLKVITNKELGGTQLISDNDFNSDFIKSYAINAIPRFILIDPEGNIVNADAARPSDDSLQEKLDALNL